MELGVNFDDSDIDFEILDYDNAETYEEEVALDKLYDKLTKGI